LHFFSTPSGLRFALTTDRNAPRLTELLKLVYRLYLDEVVKSPLYKPDQPVNTPAFLQKLDALIRGSAFFASPAPVDL